MTPIIVQERVLLSGEFVVATPAGRVGGHADRGGSRRLAMPRRAHVNTTAAPLLPAAAAPRRPRGVAPVTLLALLLAAPATMAPIPAGAASLSVAPTRVELGPGTRPGTVTLQNDAERPVTVQVQAFAWGGSAGGDDLEPTRDLIAVPPVFSLEAKAKRIIRVAARRPTTGPDERTYRLLITEVPEPPAGGGHAGVRLALRLSLPVFATPPGAEPLPVWSIRGGAGGAAPELALANRGRAHLQVRRLELRAAGRGEPVLAVDAPTYVLPGRSRAWALDLPAASAGATLRLEADTDFGPLEADLAAPAPSPPPR
jgi:fimbrial chaperone protein